MNKTYILAGLLICACIFFIYTFSDDGKSSLSKPSSLSTVENLTIATTEETMSMFTLSFSLYVPDKKPDNTIDIVDLFGGNFNVKFDQVNGLVIEIHNTRVATYQIPKHRWTPIAITFNSGVLEIYVDGHLAKTTKTATNSVSTSTNPNMNIGDTNAQNHYISNIGFYDKVLSTEELAKLSKDFHNKYNSTIKPNYGANVILRKDGEEISKLSI